MNDLKARQGEGYDLYDYDELAFLAAGFPELIYVVGTNQNAQIQGAWPNEAGWIGPLLTANVLAGAVNVPVANVVGFAAGQIVRIVDAAGSETNFIAAIVGNNLVMAVPLANNYTIANVATVYLYLPVDGQNTLFFADVACNIRLVSRTLVGRQVLLALNAADPAGLPAGLPVQVTIPAATWITLPDKWFMIYAVAVGAVAGNLIIKTSG